MATFEAIKDPDEILDYKIDWSQWLETDTIANSQYFVYPTGSLIIDSDSYTSDQTIIWLSGGTLNRTYQVTNRITTNGGRTADRTISMEIKSR